MTRTVGIAAEDEKTLLLAQRAARDLDVEVISAAPARECYLWSRYDALIYDEEQIGRDTIPIIDETTSLLVTRQEIAESDSNDVLE